MSSAVSYNSDDATPQKRNHYSQRLSPPTAVQQSASYFARVNKLQQFQRETFVNGKLTETRVSDD